MNMILLVANGTNEMNEKKKERKKTTMKQIKYIPCTHSVDYIIGPDVHLCVSSIAFRLLTLDILFFFYYISLPRFVSKQSRLFSISFFLFFFCFFLIDENFNIQLGLECYRYSHTVAHSIDITFDTNFVPLVKRDR